MPGWGQPRGGYRRQTTDDREQKSRKRHLPSCRLKSVVCSLKKARPARFHRSGPAFLVGSRAWGAETAVSAAGANSARGRLLAPLRRALGLGAGLLQRTLGRLSRGFLRRTLGRLLGLLGHCHFLGSSVTSTRIDSTCFPWALWWRKPLVANWAGAIALRRITRARKAFIPTGRIEPSFGKMRQDEFGETRIEHAVRNRAANLTARCPVRKANTFSRGDAEKHQPAPAGRSATVTFNRTSLRSRNTTTGTALPTSVRLTKSTR